MEMKLAFSQFLLPLIILPILGHGEAKDEKVRLDDVRQLTLEQGGKTTGRRLPPIDQLHCVGGTARCEFLPRVVQCYKRGRDNGGDEVWLCKTDMKNKYRFGEIAVTCEGFDNATDKYILKGSCALEYQINFIEEDGQVLKSDKPGEPINASIALCQDLEEYVGDESNTSSHL